MIDIVNTKTRGFEVVVNDKRKTTGDITLPTRDKPVV